MIRKASRPHSAGSPPVIRTVAFVVAAVLAAARADAQSPPQAFGSLVAMQAGRVTLKDGSLSQWSGAKAPVIGTDPVTGKPLMTIEQTKEKALLDWERFEVQANEILRFQQAQSDWVAINRVHSDSASRIDGEIQAIGRVFILNDNGVLMGKDAKINVHQLATGSGISDVLTEGGRTTLVQSSQKAVLDWNQFNVQAGEAVEFEQKRNGVAQKDWYAVNRGYGKTANRINGDLKADGKLFLFNDGGTQVGKDAHVQAEDFAYGAGVKDVVLEANTTTIVQGKGKAILNWRDLSTAAGQTLKFQQEKNSWVALNRSLAGGVTHINGDLTADGHVYLVAPQGLTIGGKVSAQQVIASALNISDAQFNAGLTAFVGDYNGRFVPQFSNTFKPDWTGDMAVDLIATPPQVVDPNDPLRYNVTVERTAEIKTGSFGKIMLFGPRVTNQGTLKIQDEGQVVLAAGENMYIVNADVRNAIVYAGPYTPVDRMREAFAFAIPGSVADERWQKFFTGVLGQEYPLGYEFTPEDKMLDRVKTFLANLQTRRALDVGYHARNEGIISAVRGGRVDFRGLNLEQMGAVTMTSTAQFRAAINFRGAMQEYAEYMNNSVDGPLVRGNGNVVFGRGSLTQITPDLESTDSLPLSSGSQSVGSIQINAGRVHMQEDSLIYLPSGKVNVLLDAGDHVFDNRGAGRNPDNEDGTRFLMEKGATVDLSGWDMTELDMSYHRVKGKLFAAQLADSPLQRDGALYRKEISVDRRFGTQLADWKSFDNLGQGTLAQFLVNGGTFTLDAGDDFIMKPGSVIDVSGGKVHYKSGYVYTTLLRRLDGSVIDIREADPDELYMGLANEWTVYDRKWGKQNNYYIPLMSSMQGRYETGYDEGGNGGSIEILAPDALLQGTLKGGTTIGRYQRDNQPKGGKFFLNKAGDSEGEYVSNNVLITAAEKLIPQTFGLKDKLSDVFGDFFGEEFDPEKDEPASKGRRFDNSTLVSADFFNRSTMGEYYIQQGGRVEQVRPFPALPGDALVVEAGAHLNLANSASLTLEAGERVKFLGSVRTEGGNFSVSGLSVTFGKDTQINTRGSWYSDYEVDEPVALTHVPRINGGKVSISAGNDTEAPMEDVALILPDSMKLDTSGGAWVDRNGKIKSGKGGDIAITANMAPGDIVDLSALDHARAFGLGGNGGYSFVTSNPIYVGNVLPPAKPDEGGAKESPLDRPKELSPLLIRPAFFENSGFSSLSFSSPNMTIGEGTEVHATSATLQLRDTTLLNGVLPAFYAPSGSDIYEVAEARYVPFAQRPASLRKGMDISLDGAVKIGEGSVLATEAQGAIRFTGSADVAGTVLAPAGTIAFTGGFHRSTTLHETAKLLAPGVSFITSHSVAPDGRELINGEVLPGGKIVLQTDSVLIKAGAVLDVSGTSAVFDLPQSVGQAVSRVPTTVASNGGSISIIGSTLDVNEGTFLARGGAPSAQGGAFSVSWSANYGVKERQGPKPSEVYEQFGTYFEGGYFTDLDGNTVTQFFGTDLSRVDFSPFGFSFDFAPGFKVANRQELINLLENYEADALGTPPLFVIGDRVPVRDPSVPRPEVDKGLRQLLEQLGSFTFISPVTENAPVTRLSPARIAAGGFSSFSVSAAPGILFSGDVSLGGRKPDGTFVFDRIDLSAPRLAGTAGSKVSLEAGIVTLGTAAAGGNVDSSYNIALNQLGILPVNANTAITLKSNTLTQIASAHFYGFSDTRLESQGDIRLTNDGTSVQGKPPSGEITSGGKLTFKADQMYAATGRQFNIRSGDTIEILPQDAGTPINKSPYEVAAELTLTAPRIVQGGTLRSPLGTINLVATNDGTEGAGVVRLLAGSLTSASAEGKTIPYGVTANGDTWLNPFTGLEMTTLPTKAVNLTGSVVDTQAGAVIDVSGGGDLFAREFVPGIGGTHDWLTGYRNAAGEWVSAPGQIFAVLPGFDNEVAPVGLSGETYGATLGIGDKVYLSGGSGLSAGYYTLLPAEYALLPGAFRVTAQHNKGSFVDMPLGQRRDLTDGSSIQAGYRFLNGTSYRDQHTSGFLVMPGDTLRMRSKYVEARANTFFLSDAFLKKALRTNRPVGEVPRIPLDGGSVMFDAGRELNLGATLKSAAASGGRGGFADIKASRIAVVGANTDRSKYADGYLLLDSDRLNSFAAESLLLGGVRRQGAVNLEVEVAGTDIVIDNAGSVLYGPELLFASGGKVRLESGSAVETRGQIAGSSGNLRIQPLIGKLVDDHGTPDTPGDDTKIHDKLDQGVLLRLSSSEQVDVLRDLAAVDAMAALRDDPAALAAVNAQRVAKGYAPISLGGQLTIADGVRLSSTRSIAMDATADTTLAAGASLNAKQISAAASHISVGDVPAGTSGLVFAGGSLGALSSASDITLRSYSSVDFYGGATLRASEGLRLDTRELRALNADGSTVTIAGKSLTLTNTLGGTGSAVAGGARLLLEADNVSFAGGDKWLSGVNALQVNATQRVIGKNDGTLHIPGVLNIDAGAVTAESGARLFFDAVGDVSITGGGNKTLPVFNTLGATIGVTGASVTNAGRIDLDGGTVTLRARSGNVTLADGSAIDVTGDVTKMFDKSTGVSAGTVNLISDTRDVVLAPGALIDVSGTSAGGDAGTLNVSAGLGSANLAGRILGTAQAGFRSGSFSLLSRTLPDLDGFNTTLDAGGFRQSRHFEINEGDVNLAGTVRVQDFAVVANDGSIRVSGTVETVGDNGGRIQLSAARNVTIASGGTLFARANTATGSGGNVFLETSGRNGGVVDLVSGSVIDVSGVGEGGRTVRLRGPQIGNDIAIASIGGSVVGAQSLLAEGFRVYENVSHIDQGLIDRVSLDATSFMNNAAASIQARIGGGATVVPGIELRSDGDMELVTDWDLHGLRFGDAAGVLTLRAQGDLKLNANLSDGFDSASANARLLSGNSWTFNLAAGANIASPNSLAVLPLGQLAAGKGSVIVGGTPDTIEYFTTADGSENRLYRVADGKFLRDPNETNYHIGFVELERDAVSGKYIDPRTGALIEKDPATGDYADTGYYARRPLPSLFFSTGGGYEQEGRNGTIYSPSSLPDMRELLQHDNSTGYRVRTGTADINIASGRDFVLKERPSVIYTAGTNAASMANFFAPPDAWYPQNGGDIAISAAGNIIASGKSQLPSGWLGRRGSTASDGTFAGAPDRDRDQTTWYVRFDQFESGIGALGGGNIEIAAGGDIRNLGVNIPNTGRVSGNTQPGEPMTLRNTGGGNFNLRAGGNIEGGVYYIADGLAQLTAGGSFISGERVMALDPSGCDWQTCYIYPDLAPMTHRYDLYAMLFTSNGEFRLRSGGDLNIDAVMDPLLSPMQSTPNSSGTAFMSYTSQAKVSLFSAGGDVTLWNNGPNISIAEGHSSVRPVHFLGTDESPFAGSSNIGFELYPPTVSAVAAAGNVQVLGGMTLAPAPLGNLELLAGKNVYLGYGTQPVDDFARLEFAAKNYRSAGNGIFMSQSRLELLKTPLNPARTNIAPALLRTAGSGTDSITLPGFGYLYGVKLFDEQALPDLHLGDREPARIYAAGGDIVTTAGVELPKSLWAQAGRHIYFPYYTLQHNNPDDLSIVRARGGLYFTGDGYISVAGPGRLEIEMGRDFWIPSNLKGISSSRISFQDRTPDDGIPPPVWHPDEQAADIAVSVGFNELPHYEQFEDAYLNPAKAGEMDKFLVEDGGDGRKLSVYLFDRYYARSKGGNGQFASPELRKGFVNYVRSLQGLPPLQSESEQQGYLAKAWDYWATIPESTVTPYDALLPKGAAAKVKPAEFFLPELREGLVNYVRRLQGLPTLDTQAEQLAYLDEAWGYWKTLATDYKTPLYRSVLFLELRTTGREGNDPDSERRDTTFRAYDAIAKLFPGAQKRRDETLAEGESRWAGDFETYASRVISNGGGKIEIVAPGGAFKLANVAARPDETGQPTSPGDSGNGERAGVITKDGGEINIFSRESVTLNQSRVLTTKGGNILIWSSYGDIAAGKGAKTAISPPAYDYKLDPWLQMGRKPLGLPSGSGIGTVASLPGVPVGDVDLIAPNGVVDAGDAGIRVSGNFNVFALQILGTDNIEVAGLATGLPEPPAAPPTSLNVDDAAAKGTRVTSALQDSLKQIQENSAIKAPSIIEVRVLGFGAECATDRQQCKPDDSTP